MLDMECNKIIKKTASAQRRTMRIPKGFFCEFEFGLDVWREFLWRFVDILEILLRCLKFVGQFGGF